MVGTSAPEALQVEIGWATVGAFHRWFLSDPEHRRVDADDSTTALVAALAAPVTLPGGSPVTQLTTVGPTD